MSPVARKLVPVLATLAILPLASCSDERTLTQPPDGTRYTTPTGLVTANPSQILVGAGDISTCGNNSDEATAQLLDAIPGTVFTAGDNVMPNGTTSEFANCYDPTWGRHKGRTKPAAGNHDYNTSGAAGYFAYFGAAAGEPGKGYYSYPLGAWHIVVLNSNIATAAGSAQDTWLKADLAAHPNQCTLAYYHHPLYSSASGSGSGGATLSGVRPFVNALYAAHADLVMNGHRHIYERIAPMKPDGTADPALGLREFVV
ncbi:MAG TPA: metallophosphoesterase, partial [Gemmatimonadales bacterium]